MERTSFISREQIETIEPHASLDYYLIVLIDGKGVWYAKSFTAHKEGVYGEFRNERF